MVQGISATMLPMRTRKRELCSQVNKAIGPTCHQQYITSIVTRCIIIFLIIFVVTWPHYIFCSYNGYPTHQYHLPLNKTFIISCVPSVVLGPCIFNYLLVQGDTLFLGGCGRFFEGTAEQMYTALVEKLGGLPDITVFNTIYICCIHVSEVHRSLDDYYILYRSQCLESILWTNALQNLCVDKVLLWTRVLCTIYMFRKHTLSINMLCRIYNLYVQKVYSRHKYALQYLSSVQKVYSRHKYALQYLSSVQKVYSGHKYALQYLYPMFRKYTLDMSMPCSIYPMFRKYTLDMSIYSMFRKYTLDISMPYSILSILCLESILWT